jgi:hypothetical protein
MAKWKTYEVSTHLKIMVQLENNNALSEQTECLIGAGQT